MMKQFTTFVLVACCLLSAPARGQDDQPTLQFDPNMQIDPGSMEDFGFNTDDFEDFGSEDFSPPELSAEDAAAATAVAMGMMIMIGVFAVIGVVITALVAYLLSDALSAVPESYRQMSSWIPWLLFVPLVQIVVLVLAFIKVPRSLSGYLASLGDQSQGDCGESNGLWGSILYILGCTFPIGLVLLVMSMLKINQAKRQIRSLA